ncbi:MAG: maleylpyruvate isomerase N-terminal domain-containing protein [Jiangellaceae bacterium]
MPGTAVAIRAAAVTAFGVRLDEHVEMLRDDGVKLADAAEKGGLDAIVPVCPGWQVRDVLRHLGGVHRWAACPVRGRRRRPCTAEEEQKFFTQVGDDALVGWYRSGHAALVQVLSEADAGLECWSFLPAPTPLAFASASTGTRQLRCLA